MESAILGIGLLVFVGHLLVALFKRTRVPDVLLLIGLGVLLGPYGVAWVLPEHFGLVGPVMTAVALIVILFEGGVGTSLDALARSAMGTLSLTLATAAATVLLIAIIASDHLQGWMPALIAGAILSGTSSAVVMPMIAALRLSERGRTILAMESALTDVTCIVLTVGLLDAALRGELSGAHLVGKAVSSLVSAALVGLIGGIGWMAVHERLRAVPNTRLTVIAAVFVLYGVTETIGFSGGIAALAFGVTIAHWGRDNGPASLAGIPLGRLADDERNLFSEMAFLCKLMFFLYLGISLRFTDLAPFLVAGQVVLAVYAARTLMARFVLLRACTWRDALVTSVMAPKGLAAAVIAASVMQTGVTSGELIRDLVYAVVVVSIVATSVLVAVLDLPPVPWLAKRFFAGHAPVLDSSGIGRTPTPAPPVA